MKLYELDWPHRYQIIVMRREAWLAFKNSRYYRTSREDAAKVLRIAHRQRLVRKVVSA